MPQNAYQEVLKRLIADKDELEGAMPTTDSSHERVWPPPYVSGDAGGCSS